jgi:hypothetical protein
MLTRPFKLLIGKSVSRDAQIVAGASIATVIASGNIVSGEVVVLDKNKNVLAAGATKSDSDTIYLCQGTGETFAYTNEAGTTTSTNRKVVFSDPIQASGIKTYKGRSYAALAEQVLTLDFTALTPTSGREYVIRVVYKDLAEHPGQFTQTFRYISTTATLATWITAFVAAINAFPGRRVVAADAGAVAITLTGLAIPECNTSVDDIEEYRQVNFDAFASYINSTFDHTAVTPLTKTYTTAASPGYGTWQAVRDMEKVAQGYKGITNKTQFPVIKPAMQTVISTNYDLITIEHDNSYLSSDNQYVKKTPITTVLALVVDASQATQILAALNPWMESCGVEPVTI